MENEEKMIPLRSLVTEITGSDPDDASFEADYRKIYRNLKAIRKADGVYDDGKTLIPESKRYRFVRSMQLCFEDEYYNKLFKKATVDEVLTVEEMNDWMRYQMDILAHEQSDEVKKQCEEIYRLMTEEDSFIVVERVRSIIMKDLEMICEIGNIEVRLELLKNYENQVKKMSSEYQKNVEEILKIESMFKSIIVDAKNEFGEPFQGQKIEVEEEIQALLAKLKFDL